MSLTDDLERVQHPVPRFYVATIVGAILITVLVHFERRMTLAALLVLFLGAFGLYSRWRIIPVAIVLLIGFVQVIRVFGHDPISLVYRWLIPWSRIRGYYYDYHPEPLLDALLALVLLVYLMAQYRLTALLSQALPMEARHATDRRRPNLRELPPGATSEGFNGLVQLILIFVVAIFTWVMVRAARPPVEVSADLWRGALLIWILLAGLLLLSTVLRIAYFRTAPPEVHRMLLQETLWRETRADQGRIHRWIMQRRLKAQKRREK